MAEVEADQLKQAVEHMHGGIATLYERPKKKAEPKTANPQPQLTPPKPPPMPTPMPTPPKP